MDELDWCVSHASTDEGALDVGMSSEREAPSLPIPSARYEEGPELGRGGMGVVVLAHDRVLQRSVAVKRLQVDSTDGRKRLLDEAQITARLEHPSIVAVHDAGVEADGTPWYAMRAVRGQTLAQALDAAGTLRERLSLLRSFLEVCHAVAYAHHEGVVHRDLKPANILLGPFGEVQVMDWGLAVSVTDGDSPLGVSRSSAGSGAPAYMAPEAFEEAPVTPRFDVWSLGVCLYELLTGHRAYEGADVATLREAVCTAPPPGVLLVEPSAPVELGAIVARACAHNALERYPTAAELAADVEAWLDGRLVSAHDYTALDNARRIARRNQSLAIGAVVALGAVVATSLLGGMQVLREQKRTEAAHSVAVMERQQARHRLVDALVAKAELDVREQDRLSASRIALEVLRINPDDARARGMLTSARPLPVLVSSVPAPRCQSATLGAQRERVYCLNDGVVAAQSISDGSTLWTESAPSWSSLDSSPGRVLGFRSDGSFASALHAETGAAAGPALEATRLVRASFSGRAPGAIPFRSGSGKPVHLLVVDGEGPEPTVFQTPVPIMPFRFGQDRSGTTYFADRSLSVWALSATAPHWSLRYTSPREIVENALLGGDVSDDGSTLVLSIGEGSLEVLDPRTGHQVDTLSVPVGGLWGLKVSPDGQRVAAIDQNRGVWVWDRLTRQRDRLPGPAGEVGWRNDGRLAVRGEALEVWSFPREPFSETWFVGSGVSSLDWHAGVLAVATGAGEVLGRTEDGVVRFEGRAGIENVAKDVAVGPMGEHILGVGLEKRWVEVARDGTADPVVRSPAPPARRVVWLESLRVASSVSNQLDVRNGAGVVVSPEGMPDQTLLLGDMEPSADRSSILLGTLDGFVYRIRPGTRPTMEVLAQVPELTSVAACPLREGHQTLALATRDSLSAWSAQTGVEQWSVPVTDTILDVTCSGDGRYIATGHLSGRVRVWTGEGELRGDWLAHRDRVSAVVFSPESDRLATGSWDASVRLWSVDVLDQTWAELAQKMDGSRDPR